MSLDLPFGSLHTLRKSCDVEHGLLVPRRSHDVSVGLVLDALDGGAFRSDHESYHPVGHTHLDRHVAGDVGGRSGGWESTGAEIVLPGGSDLAKVLGGREDLSLGLGDVLLATGHHEHGLLAPHRSLDVGVCLGPQRLDLAPWNRTRNISQLSTQTRLAHLPWIIQSRLS